MKNKLIKQILEFCKEMEEDKLVKLGDTMSVRFDGGMLITSSSKPMAEITEEDILFIDKKEPKDEVSALHLAIYSAREDINAIIVNHAPYCVGIAKGSKKFPACLDDMAQIIGPSAKVSPSKEIGDVLKTLNGRNACLIKGDGVIATGRTLDEAHTGSLVLEKGAIAYVGSTVLGNSVKISTFDALLMRFIYKTKYSKKDQSAKQAELKAQEGAMTELELRQQVKDAGVALLKEGLVRGTWGNISVRMDDKKMIVTPSGMDYIRMQPEDTVVVDIETLEYDSPVKPTSEKKIHAAILRDRPEINAVIHSHPVWSSAVAAARKTMPSITPKMKELVGEDVRTGAYGLPSTKKLTVGAVEALKGRNACFLANHGIFVCGKTMEEAFEIMREMEYCSKLYIENIVKEELGKEEVTVDDIIEVFYKKIKQFGGNR